MLNKAEIARRQLGAALHLFLENFDPVSVHVLACGGSEIADKLVELAGAEPFRAIAIGANPTLTLQTYQRLKHQYWNTFKHMDDRTGKLRNDAELMADFDDTVNDLTLFIGWTDLAMATGHMPIEAQCFQAWFFAIYPESLDPNAHINGLAHVFPTIKERRRVEQKKELGRVIRKFRRDKTTMTDAKTECRQLLLANDLPIVTRQFDPALRSPSQ